MKIDLTEPIECAELNVFLNEKEAYNQIFRAQLQRYAPEISFPYASMPNEFKEMMKEDKNDDKNTKKKSRKNAKPKR